MILAVLFCSRNVALSTNFFCQNFKSRTDTDFLMKSRIFPRFFQKIHNFFNLTPFEVWFVAKFMELLGLILEIIKEYSFLGF